MAKLLGGFVGVIGALWLGLAGVAGAEWWERRPAGEPAWANVHLLWWRWSPPPGLAAQRDAALYGMRVAQDGETRLESARDRQNTAIRAQAAAGALAVARGEAGVQRYRAASASAPDQVHAIAAPLTGDSICARMAQADTLFLETLR
jgi:hypothetical protein